jgi:leader peptidase (prepilin peptidase) / N-methyltransferase
VELLTGLLFAATAWRCRGRRRRSPGSASPARSSRSPSSTSTSSSCPTASPCRCCGPGSCSTSRPGDQAFASLPDAVAGAIAGYLSLWLVYQGFKLVTGQRGHGLRRLQAARRLGAWLGWQMLPLIILLSALVGAVIGIAMILVMGRDRQLPIPFGLISPRPAGSRCCGARR